MSSKVLHPFRTVKRWYLGLPARPTRISVLLCVMVTLLSLTLAIMWGRISKEGEQRCDSLLVVADLFQDVGQRSSPPNPDLLKAYIELKAYSSNHPNDHVAAFLVDLLANSFGQSGAATPTAQLLNEAGKELETACQ